MCSPGRAAVAGLLLLLLSAPAARAARQEPGADEQRQAALSGGVRVTDPAMAAALAEATAAAGKPRLFHENLVKARPLVRPDGP